MRLRFDATRGRHVLLSPESVLVINGTGAAIVELCDGGRTIGEIEAELRRRYDEVAPGDVRRFVADVVAAHGMEVDHD